MRAVCLCIFLLLTGAVAAEDEMSAAATQGSASSKTHTEQDEADDVLAVTLKSGRTLVLFPPGLLYPHYIADPHRVGFGVSWLDFSQTEIADAGSRRANFRAGGRLGLVRGHATTERERAWQLSLEVGIDAQFDADHSYDNIGWDGNYGLLFTTTAQRRLAWKLGVLHVSSHVGDEYAERTGRLRINYTRQELAVGVSWKMSEHWRSYAEAGWGYQLRNEQLQEPGRAQLGLEFEDRQSLWQERAGWYAAVDTSAMEERDWRADTSVQLGLILRSGGRDWRLGLERYSGRSPIGEFFQDTESYLALGMWMDL